MKRSSFQRWLALRITLLAFTFTALLSITILRAFQLQVIEREKLSQLIEKQYLKYVKLPPERGTIYDRKKRELAVSIEVDSLYVRPAKIKNKKEIAKKLSPLLEMSTRSVLSKFNSDRPFVWLKRSISPAQSQQIKKLNLEGIGFVEESERFYPNRELASHCVGFVGLDNKGLEGIELSYNSHLQGTPGYLMVERDALGRNIYNKNFTQVDAIKGSNLQLTIDKTMQYAAEKALEEGVKKHKASGGVAIAMIPQTGEIIAMAVSPTFNPNNFSEYTPSQWRNRAVTDTFEPGSTFKIFLISSALEEGIFQPQDIFYCEMGSYPLENRVIHDVHKYGWLSLSDIVKYSSNIGACKIGQNLGKETFYRYIRRFGFGSKTGIDLPGETGGLLPHLTKWSQVNLGTISFGQGISVSPLQLIAALSAIANGGILMKPFMVKAIFNDSGQVIKEFQPESRGSIITQRTARQITSILTTVVEKGGTGENAAIPGFTIAGKTGTAQKVDPTTKQYSPHNMVSTFIGFFPSDDPKIALLVLIDDPQGVRYGGVVAAPIFKKITLQIVRYLNIPPRQGDMTLVNCRPSHHLSPADTAVDHNFFKTASLSEIQLPDTMPDLSGLGIREVLNKAEELDLHIEIIGSGRAVSQYPLADNRLEYDRRCWVRFQPLS